MLPVTFATVWAPLVITVPCSDISLSGDNNKKFHKTYTVNDSITNSNNSLISLYLNNRYNIMKLTIVIILDVEDIRDERVKKYALE